MFCRYKLRMVKLGEPWIPVRKIQELVQLEPALFIVGLAFAAWISYHLLLGRISEERHRNLRGLFKNLSGHLAFGTSLFLVYYGMDHWIAEMSPALERVHSYIGLALLLAGAVVFVKISRILCFQYLFLGHMKVAVPLLVVNLFTLLLSIFLAGWITTELFEVRLAPLLATSAIFSVLLGLAMQDTLGNVFAGVALQFDKPYEIGDWIEVQSGPQKWTGRVEEIYWRATALQGLSDEAVTIPNRLIAQGQISNFSTKRRPIYRSQVFRLPFDAPLETAKAALLRAASESRARKDPSPIALVQETTESWIAMKLVYLIDDFGHQQLVADEILSSAIRRLEESGISLASPRLALIKERENETAAV